MSDYLDQLEEQINISEISDVATKTTVRQLLMMAESLTVAEPDSTKSKPPRPPKEPLVIKPIKSDTSIDTELSQISWDSLPNELSKQALQALIDLLQQK